MFNKIEQNFLTFKLLDTQKYIENLQTRLLHIQRGSFTKFQALLYSKQLLYPQVVSLYI